MKRPIWGAVVLMLGAAGTARGDAAPCVLEEGASVADAEIIGVWRDPHGARMATTGDLTADSITILAVAPLTEPDESKPFNLTLPRGATAQRVWRSAAGDVLVSWRSGKADRLALSAAGTLHLGKIVGDKIVAVPFARPKHAHIERMLGPVDDPSSSKLAALMMWTHDPKGAGGDSPGLVYLSTRGAPQLAAAGKLGVLTGGNNLDDTADVSDERTLTAGENGIGAVILERGETYHQLGPKGPFNLGRFEVDRLTRADGAGFPRIAMISPQVGLALWVGTPKPGATTLYAQAIDSHGAPTAEPTPQVPRVSPRSGIVADALRDVQVQGDVVFVTLQTVDDDAHGWRSTLLRLDPTGHAIAAPQSIALEAPRMVALGDGAILLWTARRALLARCPAR